MFSQLHDLGFNPKGHFGYGQGETAYINEDLVSVRNSMDISKKGRGGE
jgi:hypothetical protein